MFTIIGIDYSLICPCITVFKGDKFSFENCCFYYLLSDSTKKQNRIITTENIRGECLSDWINKEDRFDKIANWAFQIVAGNSPDAVYIEGYAFSAKGQVFDIAECTGLFLHKLWKNGIDFVKIPPTTIKKFATGKGNASKELLLNSFADETDVSIKFICNETEKQKNPSSDIIDSYYITKYGFTEVTKEISK